MGIPVIDGTQSFEGGQDSYIAPENLAANQFYSGINVSNGRTILGPRPGAAQINLTFPDKTFTEGPAFGRTWQAVFQTGKFQALFPQKVGGGYYLVAVISGYIFSIDLTLQIVTCLNPTGIRLNQYYARHNWSFAGDYNVIFDYPDFPIIIDGITVRRANPNNTINGFPAPEVPVSNIGTYNQNRLFVGNIGSEFTGGDPTGEIGNVNPPITFAEVLVPNAAYYDQFFQLGTQYAGDSITAMAFLQTVDTGTGIGPLLVSTANTIFSYRTDLPRAQWGTGVAFGSLFLYEAGIIGQRAFCNVNSDLFFLGSDGYIRSVSMSRSEQGQWSRTPISRNIQKFLQYVDKTLAQYSFMSYYNNKIYTSATPYRVTALDLAGNPVNDYVNAGVCPLELDSIATLGQPGQPAYPGLWTYTFNPMDMCQTDNNRCFMIGKDEQSLNHIYEVRDDLTYDIIENQEVDIVSQIETKAYDFEDKFSLKQGVTCQPLLSDLSGMVDVTVWRKPLHASTYLLWRQFSYNAPVAQCTFPIVTNGLAPHSPRDVILGSPVEDGCNATGEPYESFRLIQFRLRISGRDWRLRGFLARARKIDTEMVGYYSMSTELISVCEDGQAARAIPAECDETFTLMKGRLKCPERL